MHVALASISSIACILAIVLLGRWVAQHFARSWFWRYSAITSLLIVVTGVAAAVAIASHWRFGGLAERLTIAGFLQWLAGAAVVVTSAGHKHDAVPLR